MRTGHPFGNLLTQYRARKHGLSQARLAALAGYDPGLITKICQGRKELTGLSGRERVVRLIGVLRDENVLTTLDEANALLAAARLPPLFEGDPDEAALMRRLSPAAKAETSALPSRTHSHIPRPLTRFIGREQQLAELIERVPATRLITLTGAGGCGKTRLAIEVGAALAHTQFATFPDGVWLVELAPLADPVFVAQTVLTALDMPEQSSRPPMGVLRSFLVRKHLLLILDNCEHLIGACADLVQQLLNACPQLHILATSRETLHVPGEVIWRVPSLSTPDPSNLPPIQQVLEFEAISLFIERAMAAQPTFALNPANVIATAEICQRLDGIPLAIELAASRMNGLSVSEIASRLDDRFRLLTSGSRTALPRHQTLRTLIDWSYGLLSEPERILLQRLSVFSGDWTLEMAEEVCGEKRPLNSDIGPLTSDILPLLLDLINKSLVVMNESSSSTSAGESRYRLLETIRVFALEKLAQSDEAEAMRRRHADAYLALAQRAETHFHTRHQKAWTERIERELDNIRAALAWSLTPGGDVTTGMRLAGALWQFWWWHGPPSEGRRWYSDLLRAMQPGTPPDVHARVILGTVALDTLYLSTVQPEQATRIVGWLDEALGLFRNVGDQEGIAYALCFQAKAAQSQNDLVRAQSLLQQSLAVARQIEQPSTLIFALRQLGQVAYRRHEFARATALLEESLALARRIEAGQDIALALSILGDVAFYQLDFSAALGFAQQALQQARTENIRFIERGALTQMGEASRFMGHFQQARMYFEELYALSVAMEDAYSIKVVLQLLGKVACDEGNYQRAHDLIATSLRSEPTKHDWLTPFSVEWLATVASGQGHATRAARLFGAAAAIRETMHWPPGPDSFAENERHVAAARAQLDEAAFASAWAEGRAMTLDQAVEYALAG